MKKVQIRSSAFFQILFVFVMLFLVPTILHAQPDDPGADPAPIDGGASIVAAACAGYLAKRKQRKNKKIS
jgi:hypothetical protein